MGQASGCNPQVIDELRQTAQRAMRALQPSATEVVSRPAAEDASSRPSLEIIEFVPPPADRAQLLRGRLRCSALAVPFRASPLMKCPPTTSDEFAPLVSLAEAVAAKLPPELLRRGLHPRLLASRSVLASLAPLPPLILFRPFFSQRPLFTALVWLPITMLVYSAAALLLIGRARHSRRSGAPVASSWVPLAVSLLADGASDSEVTAKLSEQLVAAAASDRAEAVAIAAVREAHEKMNAVGELGMVRPALTHT